MECPASWKRAELIIDDAIADHDREIERFGASTAHMIADSLRRAGLLNDQNEPEVGWDGLRKHRDEREERHVRSEGSQRPDQG
jgi:hypothetical protein